MRNRGIALDENLELKLGTESGRLGLVVNEDITHQNQALILMCQKGEVKDDALLGVGIEDIIGEHDFPAIRSEIMQQLEREGQRVERLEVYHDRVIVEATYVE